MKNQLARLLVLVGVALVAGASQIASGEDGAVRESLDQLVAGIARNSDTGSGGLRIVQRGAYAVEWTVILPIRLRRTQAFITRSRDPQYGTEKLIRQTFNTTNGDTIDLYIASDSTRLDEDGIGVFHASQDPRVIVAVGASGGGGQSFSRLGDAGTGGSGGMMEFSIGEFAAIVAFPGNGGIGGRGQVEPEGDPGEGGAGGPGGPASLVDVTFRVGGTPAALRTPDIHVVSMDEGSKVWQQRLRVGDREFGPGGPPPILFTRQFRFGVGGPGGDGGRAGTDEFGLPRPGGAGGIGGQGAELHVTARTEIGSPRVPLMSGELIAGNGGQGGKGGGPFRDSPFGPPGGGGDGGDVILVRVDSGRATVTAGSGGQGGPGSPQPGPSGSAGGVILQ